MIVSPNQYRSQVEASREGLIARRCLGPSHCYPQISTKCRRRRSAWGIFRDGRQAPRHFNAYHNGTNFGCYHVLREATTEGHGDGLMLMIFDVAPWSQANAGTGARRGRLHTVNQ
jgi:hypothetical protein